MLYVTIMGLMPSEPLVAVTDLVKDTVASITRINRDRISVYLLPDLLPTSGNLVRVNTFLTTNELASELHRRLNAILAYGVQSLCPDRIVVSVITLQN